ncbi:MAG: nucleotidyltransferase family protein [Rubrivivax sp.]|nr:nucleotidyltransferase family protein [Rubrivivax sp.]
MNGNAAPDLQWVHAIREPAQALAWSLPQWQRVVRLSRRLRLLGRLAESQIAAGHLQQLPPPVASQLRAESRYAAAQGGALRWALERIGSTLASAPYACVLLKGAAYMGQGLAIGAGRLPSDVDILVPHAHIADAQARLQAAGWSEPTLDAHDQTYYRQWSHEVPPMRHPLHALELDLHHNILPPIAHPRVDAGLLLARTQASGWPRWQVLHPQDQLLHSAAHLFHDSELRDRLRDLVDLDGLMRHFGNTPDFWDGLAARAAQLALSQPLALACHFAQRWLQTPVPPLALQEICTAAEPAGPSRQLLQRAFAAVLTPTEPDHSPPLRQRLAAQALLMRYHRRRLPLRLLMPHLWHKWRVSHGGATADNV